MKRIFVGLCCAMLAGTGCGKKIQEKIAEKAIEAQSGGKAKVDLSGNTMTVKTDEGTVTVSGGKNLKLPASFPPDIHVVENLSIESVVEVPNGYCVSFLGKGDPQQILDTYKTAMTRQGWTLEASVNMGEQTMTSYRKGERAATVMASVEGKGVRVVLTTTTNQ